MHAVHIFNSGSLSGPEKLVLPALQSADWFKEVWSLHELRLGPENQLESYCDQLNLPVRRIEIKSRIDFKAIKKLRDAMRSMPLKTVFHSHDVKASVYTWLALSGIRSHCFHSVVTHHGATARPDHLSRLYESVFVQGSTFFADKVLCVCEADYEILLTRGISDKKLEVHRNGISLPPLHWAERRANQNQAEKKFAIIGRLSAEKNHLRMIEMLSVLRSQSSIPWTIDIIGDGPLKPSLNSAVLKHELQNQVNFLGFQNDPWKQIDLYDCVLNFSFGEGIPISLLEAGWRTTPIFASAVGGIPELCGPNGAELFDLKSENTLLANRLIQFCQDRENLKRKAESLQKRIQSEFSQTHWLSRLEEIYMRVIGVRQ